MIKVVDGDTVDLVVDLGYTIYSHQRFRLLGIDTPELRSSDVEEREAAKVAKSFVETELQAASAIYVKSNKTGKYGRYLGDITYQKDDVWYNLSKVLLDNGMAEEYAS